MLELQGFAALQPPQFQRYKIDIHLRRYSSALSNLWQAGKQHFDAVSAGAISRPRGFIGVCVRLELLKEKSIRTGTATDKKYCLPRLNSPSLQQHQLRFPRLSLHTAPEGSYMFGLITVSGSYPVPFLLEQ